MTIIQGIIAGSSGLNPYYGPVNIQGNVAIHGNVAIYGTQYSEMTEITIFQDAIIELNSNYKGNNYNNRGGLEVNLGTEPNAAFYYDDSDGMFYLGLAAKECIVDGTETEDFTFGDTKYIKLNIDSLGEVEIELADGDAEQVADLINTTLAASGFSYSSVYEYAQDVSGIVRLRSSTRGVAGQIEILAIADDAYTVLGFTAGTYNNGIAEDLDPIYLIIKSENTDVDTGTEVIDTFADTLCDSVRWDYCVKDGTNFRMGSVIAVWDAVLNTVEYTEYSTSDIGDTSGVSFSVDIDSNNVRLLATVLSDNWDIKVAQYKI